MWQSLSRQQRSVAVALLGLAVAGCASSRGASTPAPAPIVSAPPAQRATVESVTVRDPEVERRITRLEMRVLERDAQLADLEARLEDARQEVVRAMAKLQTGASRAEAASGMAEAEVALRTLKAGQPAAPEVTKVTQLLEQSSMEFNKQNYGGAVYLATQAKTIAGAGRGRITGGDRATQRSGETQFAVPVNLKTTGRGNVREGPGTAFKVTFAAEAGAALTGYSYVDEWIRVSDDTGRSGWIFRPLVTRR